MNLTDKQEAAAKGCFLFVCGFSLYLQRFSNQQEIFPHKSHGKSTLHRFTLGQNPDMICL